MNIVDIINKKRMGEELTKEEIEYTIKGFINGDIKDYQIGVEKSHDFAAMEKALNKIAKEYDHTLNVTAYDNYVSMWDAFLNRNETGAIFR